jgi:hypothetical protein
LRTARSSAVILYEAVHANDPTTVKAALELLDVAAGDPRALLLPLDEQGRAELRGLLA